MYVIIDTEVLFIGRERESAFISGLLSIGKHVKG